MASFLALYFELVIIRYLSSEIRVFSYLKNLPLVACFFGLGLGMVLGEREKFFTRIFPFTMLALFLLMRFAPELNLTHLPFPTFDYIIWGKVDVESSPLMQLLRYVGIITFISALVVCFSIPLGSRIGRYLQGLPTLKGYATDLAGSIAGIGMFSLLAFLGTPPWVWVGVGSILLFVFHRNKIFDCVVLAAIPLLLISSPSGTLWSPYYRISLEERPPLEKEQRSSAIYLSVNYDYHQKILDLSDAFFKKHPETEPNSSALLTYDLPYLVRPEAKDVLILGAGTGNDVASALRHGAEHVDAVEIDPTILEIGRSYHPEKPYDSPKVFVHVDDARAYLKKTKARYDLVVFAYLDSHTLLANSSSLRLDNYVYTVESLQEAKNLLLPGGTLVLAHGTGKLFVSARLYRMLKEVFGEAPKTYFTNYDGGGTVFVSGSRRDHPRLEHIPIINEEFERTGAALSLATDRWPFLYLRSRTIPASYGIIFFLLMLAYFFSKPVLFPRRTSADEKTIVWTRSNIHFFMLGAAFLLLETKAVTELSLLFGSTWMVNTVAIFAFLLMAMLANALLMRIVPSRNIIYGMLFASLLVSIFFPLGILAGLSFAPKLLGSGVVLASPVFFSGMLFSRAFRDATRPGEALGMNLLGALVGGVAENAVMIGGTLLLGGLAAIFYIVSLLAVVEVKKRTEKL
ncbi:MAG: methyltransferase domain-containing protein [bacterium]|nr:methyltransferase domain-containing protein [bacterium]